MRPAPQNHALASPIVPLTFTGSATLGSLLLAFVSFRSAISLLDLACFAVAAAFFIWLAKQAAGFAGRRAGDFARWAVAFAAACFAFYSCFLLPLLPPLGSQLTFLAVFAAGAVAVLTIANLLKRRGLAHVATIAALIFGALLPIAVTTILPGPEPRSHGARQTLLAAEGAATGYDPSAFTNTHQFQRRPDVYLFGVSAGAAETVLKNHLGFGHSAINSVLKSQDFTIFKNAFTEAQLNRSSYDLLLSMHRGYYQSIRPIDHGTMASGNMPSPLYEIFRANGYEINVWAESAKLGVQGPYVDHYRLANPPSLCNFHFLAQETKYFVFFGGCQLRKIFNRFTKEEMDQTFLIDNLAEMENRKAPQFTFVHLRPPHHYSKPKFDALNREESGEYASRAKDLFDEAAVNIEAIVDRIRSNGRPSIMFFFGDHGVVLSRDDGSEARIKDPFFVLDRYAILAALSPDSGCESDMTTASQKGFITSTEIVRSLVTCLAGGQDPFPKPYDHLGIYKNTTTFDLAPFVYE